jgi:aspartyl protease
MANIARIPITNVYMDGDYTGRILVGPNLTPMNVILDTGSSSLALDGTKYSPNLSGGDQSTHLAQTDSYGDQSSWTGAVINTTISIGDGASPVVLPDANAAIAYTASGNMFGSCDGILGLAYAALDDAFTMPDDTWSHQYTETEVRAGQQGQIKPYLTQLTDEGVTSDRMAFLTHRSFVHVGSGDDANDPLNQGWMIVGGGEESTDLYTGTFQTVKVLSDDWYSTNLKAILVGSADPVVGRLQGPQGMPSNSIVDSGTNSLSLSPQLLQAVISKFSSTQQALLNKSIIDENLVAVEDLNLVDWPTLTFVLEGDSGDVSLQVAPSDYWQIDTQQVGAAVAAISSGQPGLAILGLPLMNGYFTIFDGEADGGRGVIKFASKASENLRPGKF